MKTCDFSGIFQELQNHLPAFESLSEEYNAHQLWFSFNKKALQLTDKYVPSIDSRKLNKQEKPWLTLSILQIIKKQNRAFVKFKNKQTQRNNTQDKLAKLTGEYKRSLNTAREGYFNKLKDKIKTNSKFLEVFKGCGSGAAGITELTLIIKQFLMMPKKTTCLNNFFHSVF